MKVNSLVVAIFTVSAVLAACSSASDGTAAGSERGSEGEVRDAGDENGVGDESEDKEEPREVPGALVSEPSSMLVAGSDASDASIAMSEQFFDSSPGAVVTDEELQLEAASLGMAYSVPVLVEGGGIAEELERLEATWVITVGVELEDVEDVKAIPAVLPAEEDDESGTEDSAEDSAESAEDRADPGVTGEESSVPDEGEEAEADPSLTVVTPEGEDLDALLSLAEGEAFIAPQLTDVELEHGIDLLDGVVVLTDGSSIAAVGTARAAGAAIVLSPADPRGSSEAIQVAESADIVLGLFEEELEDFEWQLAAASTGVELPGGTQHVFGGKRYIALYGSPITPALGILGEQDVPSTVARAEEMTEPYRALTDDTVVPAQEVIVSVAAGEPGDDGNYSNEGPIEWFIPLIEAAGDAGQYVILDFQPGRTDFLTQVQQYEELLAYPHVGIALDPEWRLGPDEEPLTRIGHVEIDEVNEVIAYLSDYVRESNLPQKMVVLHQFQLQMIRDRDQLDLSRSEVALLIHADGQGSQGAKAGTWHALHQDAPEGIAWGWKNFIDEDFPMLTPEETYAVEPLPEFVSYQ
ncbi:MAG: hypothetical protein ACTHV1_10115 [Flaviflexus sp.]|uniref:hypothetical protein n=1 Tax=Flaviflexus sp. TaxID=1969482 RepID=UPI003F8FB735